MGADAFLVGLVAALLRFDEAARICAAAGVPTGAASTLFLIWDLGHPAKFMLALLHPRGSWISRGFLVLLGFLTIGSLTVAQMWHVGGVFEVARTAQTVIAVAAGLFALAACLYTGTLIGVIVSRPFWNNGLLPVLFLISALSSGIGLITLAALAAEHWEATTSVSVTTFFRYALMADLPLLLLQLLTVYLYMVRHFGASAGGR
jgi:formate-dependent nitrite reductase membrane component NrfD